MKNLTAQVRDKQITNTSNEHQEIGNRSRVHLADNRPSTVAQRKLRETMHASSGSNNILKHHENKTGLPLQLKSGMERLSGYSMDDVRVHYNSSKPAQLRAHAFAQGNNIHLGPGQEKHLSHELGHVVQQKRNEVTPTFQLKGKVNINDNPKLEKDADSLGERAIQLGGSLESASGLKTVEPSGNQSIIQGYFFNGAYQYTNDRELFKDLKTYVKEFSTMLFLAYQPLKKLTTRLFTEYGNAEDRHMEIGMVEKILKQWCKKNQGYAFTLRDIDEMVGMVARGRLYDINTPTWFEDRLMRDTRITEQTRETYLEAWKDKRNNRNTYKAIKSTVQDMRLNTMAENRKEAHESIREGDYLKNFEKAFYSSFTQPDLLQGNDEKILSEVKNAVLEMRKDLVVSFYYNEESEHEIFGHLPEHAGDEYITIKEGKGFSDGILSLAERKKNNPSVYRKSQDKDEKNNTDMFVYGWIEHKAGAYNSFTRFNLPATSTGGDLTNYPPEQLENAYKGGRRVSRPLDKVAVDGSLIMFGDLTLDRLAFDPKRLNLGYSDADNLILGLNLNFGKGGTGEYAQKLLSSMMNRMMVRLRRVEQSKRDPIINELNTLLQKRQNRHAALWSFITRKIMQPQFMVPKYIVHTMKGFTRDKITDEDAKNAADKRYTTIISEDYIEGHLNDIKNALGYFDQSEWDAAMRNNDVITLNTLYKRGVENIKKKEEAVDTYDYDYLENAYNNQFPFTPSSDRFDDDDDNDDKASIEEFLKNRPTI